jgi:hypothetical protein
MQNAVDERKQNGEDFFSLLPVIYSCSVTARLTIW